MSYVLHRYQASKPAYEDMTPKEQHEERERERKEKEENERLRQLEIQRIKDEKGMTPVFAPCLLLLLL